MKLFFEAYDYDPDFELQSDVRSKVYNALANIAFDINKRGIPVDELKTAFDLALEWFEDRFWDVEDLEESLNEGKRLSEVDGTIAKLFKDNKDYLMGLSSVEELKNAVVKLFKQNNIDTPKSRRMIAVEMPSIKSLSSMQKYIFDKILAGDDLSVI